MRETKNGKQQAGSHLSLLLSKKRRSFAESQDIKLQISYIMEDEEKVSGLPENAYRELKEGEVYKPILSPDKQYREVTPWSVFWGLVMACLLYTSPSPRDA